MFKAKCAKSQSGKLCEFYMFSPEESIVYTYIRTSRAVVARFSNNRNPRAAT